MPSLGSGYTFEDFLKRLERSPVTHMSPLYHEHRELFVRRPDMFSRAIGFLSWEKGSALIDAAYHSQVIDVTAYRALLARMLRHNREVRRGAAGSLVPWPAALRAHSNAMLAHGAAAPARLTRSAVRLLAAHRQSAAAAAALHRLCAATGTALPPPEALSPSPPPGGTGAGGEECAAAALRRLCAGDTAAWRSALPALRSATGAAGPAPLPREAASALVLQLRAARRPGMAVAVLLECLVPTRTPLTPQALEAMLECVFAHSRARALPAVHWRTALGCATDVLRGGEGPGPHALSPRALSLLIHICVGAGSPEGALRAMGHARTADKTELAMSSEIRALLYCMAYDRPNEAEAIVRQAEKRHGEANAQLLERLCETAREAKGEGRSPELSLRAGSD